MLLTESENKRIKPVSGENRIRRSATIMFTDIYGYSRLMSMNENLALAMLSEHDRIVENIIKSFKGNIIKKMGDAILADFDSAGDALNCALAIQNDLKKYNENRQQKERIIIRIGLHMGNVVIKDNDLFGHDINVAARLEPLADPGGICISQSVYDAVKEHIDSQIIKVGDVSLKNILQKYVIYKIPSIYGQEFSNQKAGETRDKNCKINYKISKINNISVPCLSPADITVFTLLFCIIFMMSVNYVTLGKIDLSSIFFLIRDNFFYFTALISLLVLTMIYFYAAKSVRIVFSDIRDADNLLEFLITQMGYHTSVKQDNILIFKPSLYQFLMYSARTIKAAIDGNSVVITGNWMFVSRLVKLIQSCET